MLSSLLYKILKVHITYRTIYIVNVTLFIMQCSRFVFGGFPFNPLLLNKITTKRVQASWVS